MREWARKGGKRYRRLQVRRADRFLRWVLDRGVPLHQVGHRHKWAFLDHLRREGLSDRTLQAYRHAIEWMLRLRG